MNPVGKSLPATLSQTPFDIKVRVDLTWDFSEVPVAFEGTDPSIVCLWAALSAAAPPAERFFIKALKPTLDTISGDTKLRQDVENMIAQEVRHSAAHIKLNKHLETLGFDMKAATAHIEAGLEKMVEGLSPTDVLGVVAAGEHTIYAFARVFVSSPEVQDSMHPAVARLFKYHFLEEAEHGAVSHDQYRYFVGDHYAHRIRMASRARHLYGMLDGAMRIFEGNIGHRRGGTSRARLYRYLWLSPGLLRKVAGLAAEYLYPGYRLTFQHEDLQLLQRWESEVYAGQSR
jgi:uncharacterized protein